MALTQSNQIVITPWKRRRFLGYLLLSIVGMGLFGWSALTEFLETGEFTMEFLTNTSVALLWVLHARLQYWVTQQSIRNDIHVQQMRQQLQEIQSNADAEE